MAMPKRSREENRLRDIASYMFEGRSVASFQDAYKDIKYAFHWNSIDVMIINTNFLFDMACQNGRHVGVQRDSFSRVGRDAVKVLDSMQDIFQPTNVVVCSDGAMPFAVRKGVKVDNCNAEAFRRVGKTWANGSGWMRPYSAAERTLGQALSPGSYLYQEFHREMHGHLLRATDKDVSEETSSLCYLPHTEYGSWEEKSCRYVGMIQKALYAEKGEWDGASRELNVVIVDSSVEMMMRTSLHGGIKCMHLLNIKVALKMQAPGKKEDSGGTLRSKLYLVSSDSIVNKVGEGFQVAAFVLYWSMSLGCQVAPPMFDSPFCVECGDREILKSIVDLFGNGWKRVRENSFAFLSRGEINTDLLFSFVLSVCASIDNGNKIRGVSSGALWESFTNGLYIRDSRKSAPVGINNQPVIHEVCRSFWKAHVWNLCYLGWTHTMSHLDSFCYWNSSSPSATVFLQNSDCLPLSVKDEVVGCRRDFADSDMSAYVDNYGYIRRRTPDTIDRASLRRHCCNLVDLQFITTCTAGSSHCHPDPLDLFHQIESVTLSSQFENIAPICHREISCTDILTPDLLRPMQLLSECS